MSFFFTTRVPINRNLVKTCGAGGPGSFIVDSNKRIPPQSDNKEDLTINGLLEKLVPLAQEGNTHRLRITRSWSFREMFMTRGGSWGSWNRSDDRERAVNYVRSLVKRYNNESIPTDLSSYLHENKKSLTSGELHDILNYFKLKSPTT